METSTVCVDSVNRRSESSARGRVRLIPFRARHVRLINPQASEAVLKVYEYAQDNGLAWTACVMGTPIGAAGMTVKEGNTAEVWCLFTPLFKLMPITLYALVRQKLKEALSKMPSDMRIFCHVDPADLTAVRFVERLGFEPTLRVYEVKNGSRNF